MTVVDDYFASLEPPVRETFEQIRALAVAESPDAEQATSYGLAALRHRGKPLIGFQATATHLAVYPFSPAAVDAVRPLLTGFALSKGTIRFGLDTPLPVEAVRVLLRHRIAEIEGRTP